MSENAKIQSKAKSLLSGFMIPAMVGTLIFLVLDGISSFTYGLSLILAGPLGVGYVIFLMKIIDQKITDYNALFAGFYNFANTLVAGLLTSIAVAVGAIFLIVPGIIIALGLGLTFCIMAEDSNISGVDAMQKSWDLMKGHKWELFCLYFRYIGWWLLALITFGIVLIYIYPRVQVAVINFYRNIKYGQY